MAFKMKAALLAASISVVVAPLAPSIAAAQTSRDTYDSRDSGYDAPDGYDARGAYDARRDAPPPNADYDDRYYDENYDRNAPRDYDGTRPPPPPPGWRDDGNRSEYSALDDRYADNAERWAQNNCVKSQNNAAVGAVVGGLIGALVGNGLSSRRDRTGGTIAGAAVGAVGGAAVGGASSNATSPGCPPGYVVRGGAARFDYAYAPGFVYAAPAWYRPWVFYGNRWVYRPYPYARWYGRYYARPYGWRRPYYGRPGWRRPPPRRW